MSERPSRGSHIAVPSVNPQTLRREWLVTLVLLAVLSVVVAIEYGYAYALIVVSVIVALGVEVWLFLAALTAVFDIISKRAALVQWRLIALLTVAAIALHAVSPAPLGTATKYAAAIAAVVFVVMTIFNRRI